MTEGGREVVFDYEFLLGRQNKMNAKEQCVVRAAASETICFKRPKKIADHRSSGNGLNWADGNIVYKELYTDITETVAGLAHLYSYGVSKYTFLAGLTGRPFHNLEDLECPEHVSLNQKPWFILPSKKFPKFACAAKTADSLYDCLMYYLQRNVYVQCPADMKRHTA